MKKTMSFLIFIFLIALPITFVDMVTAAFLERYFALGIPATFFLSVVIMIVSAIPAAWIWHKVEQAIFKEVVV
ncbi:hypothetical protein pEaSNUABM56_00252 [Erwinia phage pEa_SNUABM_56]|uniref:Uncharacterized protein n=1 Tax=Erwinia phage pEp_SNUABM_01 TaxID=2601643 RepID=A0A5J6DB45_9CAUD|nr:hypothetical protein HWC63_gp151 [Erwinia phage pEp_SNUABM_01]QEQ95027.1 hypothetical protein pEpSNUABM01_201 [Erwinia phage pEp_SNUABM_01]UYL84954.1 hypothetical protein pEaSNUABM55_00181 [Erwinia phage pEa_SNUABM_55]UYL85272.1 hypothetical protein pEaSNUABM56_00252 [Erwinia phage pEa_SNUABM_56]